MSALWNAADRLYDLGGKNPAKRLSPGALAPRTTRIDEGAFAAWYAKVTAPDMNPVRRDLQLVSLFTGIRSDGIRQLRWEDIDHERILLPPAEHHRHPRGLEILRDHRPRGVDRRRCDLGRARSRPRRLEGGW